MYYRKKPVTIEAMEFTYPPSIELLQWVGNNLSSIAKDRHVDSKAEAYIQTLEDSNDESHYKVKHVVTEGDFIIKGVQGEFYACKPDIFWQTYEKLL